MIKSLFFAKALGFCVQQSSCINLPANSIQKQDELASVQSLAKRSNAGSNEAFSKALTPPKTSTPLFVSFSAKDFFTKFIKAFI